MPDDTLFSLTFNERVMVKVTSVDRFSFMGALNFFGSNLGLWPGLGLYQILEWVTGLLIVGQALRRIRRRFIGKSNGNDSVRRMSI